MMVTQAINGNYNNEFLDILMNKAEIARFYIMIKSVNHELRQEILSEIHKNPRTRVTELYKKLNIEQSVLSQHLALLRTNGFVNTIKEGRYIYYSVNIKKFEDLRQCLEILIEK